MYGVYINCKRYPFIRWILSGDKIYESRTRDMLRNLTGHRVALIETGTGIPMIMGYATITGSIRTASESVRNSAMITGTAYDVAHGRTKVFYRLSNVTACAPHPLPERKINHGRSYTEY